MPTDVSGTINIIAEVVGQGKTSPGQAKNILDGKNKKDNDSNANSIFGISLEMKNLQKIIGLVGLLGSSKIVSSALSTIFRLLGTLVDLVLMPLIPLFARGIKVFANIVNFINNFSWPTDWGQVWDDLKLWWENQWETKGGLWGIIKGLFLDASGVALTAALLAGITKGPSAGWWVLKNTFGAVPKWSKSFIKKIFGWSKSFVTTAIRWTAVAAKWAGGALASGANLLLRLIPGGEKAALFTKKMVKKAFGLGKAFAGTVARAAWKTILFSKTAIFGGLAAIFGAIGLGGLTLAGTAWIALIATLIVGAIVATATVIWLANWLFVKAFGMTPMDMVRGLFGIEKSPGGQGTAHRAAEWLEDNWTNDPRLQKNQMHSGNFVLELPPRPKELP